MSPAPQRSASNVALTDDLQRQIAVVADATNTPFDRTLETLLGFGLAEQSRRAAELKDLFENFHSTPQGTEKDAAMDLLGEAIFGK